MTATPPAGWIYMQHTAADPKKYVGQSKRPVYRRIQEERRTFTWGPQILPGRQGYTILMRVESLGHPVLDAIALDLAEAEMIALHHPSENANRPDPEMLRRRLAAAQQTHAEGLLLDPTAYVPWKPPRAARPTTPRPTGSRGDSRGAVPRARRVGDAVGSVARGVVGVVTAMGLIAVGIGATWVAFLMARPVGIELGHPWVPWVVTPMVGLLAPAWLYHRMVNPPRRRRVYRGGTRRRR